MAINIKEIMNDDPTPKKFEWLPRKAFSRREAFERREATIEAIEELQRKLDPHLISMPNETREAYTQLALHAERIAALELETIKVGD